MHHPEHVSLQPSTALVELAPWAAVGGGVRAGDGVRGIGALTVHGAASLPISRLVRVGAWTSPGTVDFRSFDASAGGRVEWHSNDTDDTYVTLFGVGGRWTALADLGAGNRFGSADDRGPFLLARVAFGFTARNRLGLYGSDCRSGGEDQDGEKPCRATIGLVSGVRPFVTVTRALDRDRTEVTAGLEFEVIGAGWWIGAGL